MVKAVDGVLQLTVQYFTVGDDDHRIEDGFILIIVQAGKPVGSPGDAVGLAGAGTVLDQIIVSGAVLLCVGNQFAHHIQLMIAGENDLFGHTCPHFAVRENGPLGLLLIADELLENIQKLVLLENGLPQIRRHISTIRVLWVACSAVHAGAVAALVEGEKDRFRSQQTGTHGNPV